MSNADYSKVVLSRTVEQSTNLSALEIFQNLNKYYKNTFNYIISNETLGTWIGATPELLLEAEGQSIKTVSLAGTKLNNSTSIWTNKEKEEQKIVTEYIIDILKTTGCNSINTTEPYTSDAGPIQHLKTDIKANTDSNESWKKILPLLHPTPATCGFPMKEAKEVIEDIEIHSRKYYTGYIGLVNSDKKRFFVNLRCMEYHGNSVLLYLGGGITSDSNPQNEWDETINKAETLKKALK